MNDDDVSARDEAASAYLDGDLDATERASVSADPETMARVETFTQLRRTINDTEPVTDEVRDAAISAALAAFDVRQQIIASAPAHSARVSVLRTRWQRSYRVLSGVAAAAVIAVIAVAALNATKGEDMKSSSATTPINAAPRTEMALGSAPDGGGAPAATSAASATTPAAASDKIAAAELPAVNSEADLAQYASGFAAGATTAAAPAPADSAMSSATELVPVPAVPPSGCIGANDIVLGPISVFGAPAWAVRDTSTNVVRAIDAADCHLLLSSGP